MFRQLARVDNSTDLEPAAVVACAYNAAVQPLSHDTLKGYGCASVGGSAQTKRQRLVYTAVPNLTSAPAIMCLAEVAAAAKELVSINDGASAASNSNARDSSSPTNCCIS